MFRLYPSLAAELITGQCGMDLPSFKGARLASGDLTNVVPTEFRADAVVVLAEGDSPAAAVIVEVQLSRDGGKRWSWPVYLSTLRARLHCPTMLLVICADAGTASWCATDIKLGHPGLVLAPLVLGPAEIPVVIDPDEARRSPELTALSAMTHATHPDRNKILDALFFALQNVDAGRAANYHDVVFAALPGAVRAYLEDLMTSGLHEYRSPFLRKYIGLGRTEGRTEGEVKGRAEAVLAVLAARGVDVSDDAHVRITECDDLGLLDTWVRRAVTAETVNDLFD